MFGSGWVVPCRAVSCRVVSRLCFFSAWYVPGLFLSGWFGDDFCVFCPVYPPAQCRGWSGQSGHSFVAHDTFPELWAGFRCFLAYSVLVVFSSYRSRQPLGSWGVIWIKMTTVPGALHLLVFVFTFRFSVDTFSPYSRCGWHGDGLR